MYAVIRTGGKQYRVAPGDVVKIEKVGGEANSPVEFNNVLAFTDGDSPIAKPSAGKVLGTMGSMGHNAGQFFGVHMEATDSKGNLYTGEVFYGERVQRFLLQK